MTRRGRRDGGSSLVTILWRDIPAQVNAGVGSGRCQRILPRRFQKAIDRAAMVAGKTQASDYVAEWRRLSTRFTGDPAAAAIAEAARLEAAFPIERLNRFVATGGWDPDRTADATAGTTTPDPGASAPASPPYQRRASRD